MLLDTLDRSPLHEGFHPSFPRAFAWLAAFDPSTPDGRVEIDGPGLVAIVQRYNTAPAEDKKWETHRVHGDIQYLVTGGELVGYAPRGVLTVKTPYNPEKDAEFYAPPATTVPSSLLSLPAGSFAVFLPHDAHQPGMMVDQPSLVLKVVIKFRL